MKRFFHSEEKNLNNILNAADEMGVVLSDADEFMDEEVEEVIFYEVE